MQSIRREYYAEARLYKVHHQHFANWCIHSITVPAEFFSFVLLAQYFGLDAVVCLAISGIIAAYYLLIPCPASSAAAYGVVLTSWWSVVVYDYLRPPQVWILALVVQFIAWCLQVVVGHYMIEQNSPAMGKRLTANSVVLSFLLAWDYSS